MLLDQLRFSNQKRLMADRVSFQQKITVLKDIVDGFPLKCKLFLQLLLSYLPQNGGAQLPKDFKKAYISFTQTFQKMNNDEKVYFIGQVSDCIAARLKNHGHGMSQILQGIETSCEMKTSFMRISFWEKRNFKYMQQCSQIHLTSSKKEDILELKNYLVRKSASEKNSMVFEAIEKSVSEKMVKITLKFSNSSIFQEIYSNIRKNIILLTTHLMEDFLKEDIKEIQANKEPKRPSKGFTILTTKTMTEYFNTKQKMLEKVRNTKAKALLIYKKDDTKIFRSSENKKYYYLEQNIHKHQTIESIKEHTPITGSQSIPNKIIYEVLQSFTQNITANYYKLDVGKKQYEFVVIADKTEREDSFQITMKTATHFFLDISIEFVLASIKKITENHFSFSLSLILDPHSRNQAKINAKVIDLMLAMSYNDDLHYKKSSSKNIPALGTNPNFSAIDVEGNLQVGNNIHFNQTVRIDAENHYEENMISGEGKKESSSQERSDEKSSEDNECFFTICQDEDEPDLEFFDCIEEKMMSRRGSEKIELETELTIMQDPHYLKTKAFTLPIPKETFKYLKEHYLFVEWKRSPKGGVVCINEEVIKEQNKILKLVITRIGRNIFKGNSIMNISLPIQLFRDESSLVSLARNVTYAPLLIEPAVNFSALKKMKNTLIFQISMSPLALSTKKPFNPIIGETYQAEIGGCPIFMEQLSHHPPISSLFFVGRGYKIYGTFQVEATLGLNCARGSSNARLAVEFDDGDKLSFDLPTMVINGLIFGERAIYYEGAAYIVDTKNYLIAEITYNANNLKKGIFSFKNDSPDFLAAEIYQVSQNFMNKFLSSKKKMSPKKDEENCILSKVEGEWNGKIFIDGKEEYDFEKQLPLELEAVSCPLPSDSTTRTDVFELKKGDMNIAQDEKDRLQDIQRRDKKMRQNFRKTNNQSNKSA